MLMQEDSGQNQPQRSDEPVTWTASEFIAHHKTSGWYFGVMLSAVILCGAVYLLTKDIISIATITIVVILFMVISSSKPKQQAYSVNSQGISIGQKFYPYSLFKSFMIAYDGPIGSITFEPLKRFMPEITIYFAPEDEQRIVDVLGGSLPNGQRKEKGVDRLMRRVRF